MSHGCSISIDFLLLSLHGVPKCEPLHVSRQIVLKSAPIELFSTDLWATVRKTVCPMLSDRCLSCLSVCNVGVLWPNGWMDQDETWHAVRPRPWAHCVRWGPSSPSPKGAQSHNFRRPNGCIDQDATWYGGRHRPRRLLLDGDPPPLAKKGAEPPPNFRSMFIVAKQLDGLRWYLARR